MSSARLIKILVFADFLCPYSYIGHKALTDAIDECSDLPVKFEVEYRAFRLNSSLAEDFPVDRKSYFTHRYGDKYPQIQVVVKGMSKSMGLKIVEDGQLSQSTRAHRLAAKAYQIGGESVQQQLLKAYFKAFFEEGKDIGNLELLGNIVQEIGFLSKAEAINFLKSSELTAEIENTMATARANGISGSPVVIVDGKFKLDGVQTKDVYLQVFKRLGRCEHAVAAGSPCSDTSSDGTISPPKSTAVAV